MDNVMSALFVCCVCRFLCKSKPFEFGKKRVQETPVAKVFKILGRQSRAESLLLRKSPQYTNW